MNYAIIQNKNGRRHEVDFDDLNVEVKIFVTSDNVEVAIESNEEFKPSDKQRFAIIHLEKDKFFSALRSSKVNKNNTSNIIQIVKND